MAFEDWFVSHARVSDKVHRKVTLDDKVAFFQQLSTLISSGTALLQAIQICADQSQSTRMLDVREMAAMVSSGNTLHDAMQNHPQIFELHWIEVIQTGETSGQLGPVLLELNDQIRDYRSTRAKDCIQVSDCSR
jgi:type IV pilus assembly protein PilC